MNAPKPYVKAHLKTERPQKYLKPVAIRKRSELNPTQSKIIVKKKRRYLTPNHRDIPL
jgi:hypothetical protein